MKKHGQSAIDDDGLVFDLTDRAVFDTLEVAHILPHSLTSLEGNPQIVRSCLTLHSYAYCFFYMCVL